MKIYNIRFWTFGGWFTWGSIAVGVIGAGASLIGAGQQADANASAQAANQAAQAEQNRSAWANYLMTRGLYTGGSAPTGVIPTSGVTAVNSRLPLWANVNISGAPKKWVKAGTASPAGRFSLPVSSATPAATAPPANPGTGAPAVAFDPSGNLSLYPLPDTLLWGIDGVN